MVFWYSVRWHWVRECLSQRSLIITQSREPHSVTLLPYPRSVTCSCMNSSTPRVMYTITDTGNFGWCPARKDRFAILLCSLKAVSNPWFPGFFCWKRKNNAKKLSKYSFIYSALKLHRRIESMCKVLHDSSLECSVRESDHPIPDIPAHRV